MDINCIIKTCKVLLLDIEGTTTSISFVKDTLFPYAADNIKQYLEAQWEKSDVKEAISALRKLALEDKENNVEGLVTIPEEDASKEDQIGGLVNNVKWQMSSDRKTGALKLLQGLIWKQGYDSGDIKGHVFEDVSPALEQWRATDSRKVYIYSSGSVQAQKLLFGQSSAGDMLGYFDGHFDTAVGAKQESSSYTKIAEEIGCKPEEILFLTDIVKEAEAAKSAGLQVALVSREGNAPLPAEIPEQFPVLHSFTQLSTTNKRKIDSQDEVPAKIAKTDSVEVQNNEETDKKSVEEEIMELDQVINEKDDNSDKVGKETEDKEAENMETTIEEITESESNNLAVVDIEPIVTEKVDDSKQDNDKDAKNESMKNKNISEDKTEIEEISESSSDINDICLDPIVEEPPNADSEMEELQNVGEVLEKECDDILTKVNVITNSSVPPIIEDNMSTENADTSDIVESILDSEIEMELNTNKVNEIKSKTNENKIEINEIENEINDVDNKTNKSKNIVTEVANKSNNDGNKIQAEVNNSDNTTNKNKVDNVNDVENTNEVKSTNDVEKKPNEIENGTNKIEDKTNNVKDVNPESKDTRKNETTKEIIVDDTIKNSQNKDSTSPSKIEEIEDKESNHADTASEKTDALVVVEADEKKVNGKTNGNADITLNGDSGKLKERLSSGNSKEMINGTGEVNGAEGKGETNTEIDVTEIKVKSVPTEEKPEPMEQVAEA